MKNKALEPNPAAPRTNVTHANFFPQFQSHGRGLETAEKAKRGPGKLEMEVNAVESPAPKGLSCAEVER